MPKNQPWLPIAQSYTGLKEVPGKENNPKITNMLIRLRYGWRDDATPWCGTFVAFCLLEAGITPNPTGYRALSWAQWGTKLVNPRRGCIAVFSREGGGHVAYVLGLSKTGKLVCVGGNQGDKVSVALFDRSRVVAYVYPTGYEPPTEALPILEDNGMEVSKNEQ